MVSTSLGGNIYALLTQLRNRSQEVIKGGATRSMDPSSQAPPPTFIPISSPVLSLSIFIILPLQYTLSGIMLSFTSTRFLSLTLALALAISSVSALPSPSPSPSAAQAVDLSKIPSAKGSASGSAHLRLVRQDTFTPPPPSCPDGSQDCFTPPNGGGDGGCGNQSCVQSCNEGVSCVGTNGE